MPLKHGKSQKAFEHNVKAEMKSGKPQDQALAIAYSVKRKAKKMAKGGKILSKEEQLARSEAIKTKMDLQKMMHDPSPMREVIAKRKAEKADKPKLAQGGIVKTKSIKDPRMVEGILKVRKYAEGGELSAADEKRPMPEDLHDDKAQEHALHRKPAKGSGSHDEDAAEHAELESHANREIGEGPEEDHDPEMSPIRESYRSPAEDEFMSDHEQMLADGGEISPEDEIEDEHEASIAAAIMARDNRKKMAEGGQVDLSINADEEPNNEDQMSFEALKKENYSESEGLDQLDQPEDSNEIGDEREMARSDKHDRVDRIMRIARKKR